ncbi:6-phosphogluconolactonase [Amphritea sp. 1_MG-2023]|uniref:6-phosphogluconolactonase n=1 Tax=Amphritea sp. 1_MG-2023 TaxID=3062670 RepID=UPI0026E29E91|nr:6-phosphogluconolactonase [Amphritea sp. 1_MG-2023]MDO6563323.1 6-phosphogluconolactonase [Amphritea sp. 1_MG-2023]
MKISELSLPKHITLCDFSSREALTHTLAEHIARQLSDAINSSGKAYLAVSGGTTPVPLFKRLSQIPLAWHQVTITLADERWINPDQPDSNEYLVRTALLQQYAGNAHFIPLWQAGMTAAAAAQHQTGCQQLSQPFDIVLLGMGNDGHTASLFPDAAELSAALQSQADSVAINPTHASYARLSLTPSRLLNSQQRILHIVGQDKLTTLTQALISTPQAMPINLFLQQPLTIFWAP